MEIFILFFIASFEFHVKGITVKMVPAGAEHIVAITEDGDLYGWG